MGSTLPDDPRDIALGIGAGVCSLLLGIGLSAVAALDRVALLDQSAVVGALLALVLAFSVAGLYEITGRESTPPGAADLTIGAGIVLALLAPYGANPRAFVGVGALALLGSGVYHAARATRVVPDAEESTAEVDRDGAT